MTAVKIKAEQAVIDRARGYTDEDLAEVEDSPEWVDGDFARARPFSEAEPEIHAAWTRSRGAQKAPTKVAVSIRLSRDVLDRFRADGPGWQGRMDAALRKAVGL